MKLFITRRATRRVVAIAEYIRNANPKAAIEVELAIREAFELIAAHPEIGRPVKLGLRRLPVPRLPYLIYYSVVYGRDRVEIITVSHSARRKQP